MAIGRLAASLDSVACTNSIHIVGTMRSPRAGGIAEARGRNCRSTNVLCQREPDLLDAHRGPGRPGLSRTHRVACRHKMELESEDGIEVSAYHGARA